MSRGKARKKYAKRGRVDLLSEMKDREIVVLRRRMGESTRARCRCVGAVHAWTRGFVGHLSQIDNQGLF